MAVMGLPMLMDPYHIQLLRISWISMMGFNHRQFQSQYDDYDDRIVIYNCKVLIELVSITLPFGHNWKTNQPNV